MTSLDTLKIVHLSTSHTGGAGIAARRLHKKLLDTGVQSYFVSLAKPSYNIEKNESGINRTFMARFVGKINTKFSQQLSKKTYLTLFSVASLKVKKLKKFGSPSDTIFHIHNWFNLINLRELKKLLNLGYKIIFTLHDQRLFTGGCHYSLECSKFRTNCKNCPYLIPQINYIPKLNLKRTRKIFTQYSSQIEIIAPSAWIQKLAKESSLLRDFTIHHVPNIHGELATESYTRDIGSTVSQKNHISIGVASIDKHAFLKGGLIIENVEKLVLLRKINAKILYLSDVNNIPDQFEKFWNVIDYLLVPSILDNSPNVIHEAKLLGIPIIATNVGGITELLNLKYDYLVELNENTHHAIIETIERILYENPKSNRQQVRDAYTEYISKSLNQIKNIYINL